MKAERSSGSERGSPGRPQWLKDHAEEVYGPKLHELNKRPQTKWNYNKDGFPNPTCAQLAIDILLEHHQALTKENKRITTKYCLEQRYGKASGKRWE
jgi:hypothetical protein